MSTQSAEWIKTARVVRRSGFGARGSEIDSALAVGDTSLYVSELLRADFSNDPGIVATPMPVFDVPERSQEFDASDRRRHARKVSALKNELIYWWIRRMVAAENPANEKLTFLRHNHFATSIQKVRTAKTMANQNEKLRRLCLGNFYDLAYAMLTDAAMVKWLDGQQNKAGSPNENLSREFLELFALGHGQGYSEKDVREGARALTGWIIGEDFDTEFVPTRYDESTKTILGTTAKIGLEEFCGVVLSAPNSSAYVAGRLWQQIASDEQPSAAVLERLVNAYGPNRDLYRLTTAILTDPDFLQSSATVVTSPVDWLVGLLRAVRAPLDGREKIKPIASALRTLGQLPFHPPDVGGWPTGQAWLSSSAVNVRLRVAGEIAEIGDVSMVEEAGVNDRIDAAGYLIGVGAWSDRSATALKPLRDNSAALVAAAVNTPEYLTS